MKRLILFIIIAVGMTATAVASVTARRLNPTTVEVRDADGRVLMFDFYGPNIVRLFLDPRGGIVRNPEAQPPAEILVEQPRCAVGELTLDDKGTAYIIQTPQLAISIEKASGRLDFTDRRS